MREFTAIEEPTPVVRRLVGFVRLARANGFDVGLAETRDSFLLARAADLTRPGELRLGLRALLCKRPDDWRRYDELFEAYWLRRGMRQLVRVAGTPPSRQTRKLPGLAEEPGREAPADHTLRGEDLPAAGEGGRRGGATRAESVATKDLRHIDNPAELARVAELTERLARRLRDRLTRRRKADRRGAEIDLRGTIHRSIAYGGTPLLLKYRRRRLQPLRLVVLLDVSGSMAPYNSFFLRFLRGIVDRFASADAFLFHTRLIHVAETLRERDMGRALDRLSLIAAGFEGGTRIGESLAEFNRHHAKATLAGRCLVVIVSDGYDKGDPGRLAVELAQIRKRAWRVVWLNPMMGWPGYSPVAAGMAAALPHIDLLAPAHNLESLAALEDELVRL